MKRVSIFLLVLLAVGVIVLDSAEPAGQDCSVADLNLDCTVDLRDYARFQNSLFGPVP